MTPEIMEELLYFVEEEPFQFSDETVEEVLDPEKETTALLIKQSRTAVELETTMDEYIQELVYGSKMAPPGSPDSAADKLQQLTEPEEESEDKATSSPGIWCPPNEMVKAVSLKLFFRKLAKNYLIPEPEPTPDHLAVVFECLRRSEIWTIMQKYPNEIMRYGFFTSDKPEEAELVAKSMKKYEHTPNRNFKEKLVIQLSKKKSECLLEFAQARPLYMSPNATEGKRQCKIFFPDGYDEPPVEEEEEAEEDFATMSAPPDVLTYLGGEVGGEEEESEESEESEEESVEDEEEEEEEDEMNDDFASLFTF